MSSTEVGLLTLAALAWIAVGLTFWLAKKFHRDEVFVGVPPGVIPAQPDATPTERVKGAQEYSGEIPVAFNPPKGITPGLVGTVIDGSVDARDLTATLVDLAVRGHLTIDANPVTEVSEARAHYTKNPHAKAPTTDWRLTRRDAPASNQILDFERHLLDGLFHGEQTVSMAKLDQASLQALREAQVGLYRQAVDGGWYPRHPRQQGRAGCLVIGLGVLLAAAFVAVKATIPGIIAAVLILGAAIALTRALRGRTPRTAYGSALRVQALGFKTYLATAEANQFTFEQAAGIFSRYLPYALIFGVAQHWTKVFADLALQAKIAGVSSAQLDPGLDWFYLDDLPFDLINLLRLDSLDGNIDLFGATDMIGDAAGLFTDGLGDMATGLGDLVTGLGDFLGSLDFLDGIGDGCNADGCGDVGGCIDF